MTTSERKELLKADGIVMNHLNHINSLYNYLDFLFRFKVIR
jgi:hypothetical protein